MTGKTASPRRIHLLHPLAAALALGLAALVPSVAAGAGVGFGVDS